jgi:hypothetical protein
MLLGLIATQIETNVRAAGSRATRELVHKWRVFKASIGGKALLRHHRHAPNILRTPPDASSRAWRRAQKKFSRPHTCSRHAAPTLGHTNAAEEEIEKQPHL